MQLKSMVRIALFAALTAIFSQLVIPTVPVPFTFSLLSVYLCGLILPKKEAFFAQIVFIFLGAVGLPVFASLTGGLGILFGATGGYIWSYPLMAYMIAFTKERFRDHIVPTYIATLLSIVLCYTVGTLWLKEVMSLTLPAAFSAGVVPFIPLDLAKIIMIVPVGLLISKRIKKYL